MCWPVEQAQSGCLREPVTIQGKRRGQKTGFKGYIVHLRLLSPNIMLQLNLIEYNEYQQMAKARERKPVADLLKFSLIS